MRRSHAVAGALVSATLLLGLLPAGAAASGGSVVISQVYGGGGNVSATYLNDFVELHNRSTGTVDITGWAIQYGGPTSTTYSANQEFVLPSASVAAGGYFLIKFASGGANGSGLPTADADGGSINLGQPAGKIALTSNSTGCPTTCSGAPPGLATTRHKVVIPVVTFGSAQSGVATITTMVAARVEIDGFGASRR